MTVRYADDRLAEICRREADWVQHRAVCGASITLGDGARTSVESHLFLPGFFQQLSRVTARSTTIMRSHQSPFKSYPDAMLSVSFKRGAGYALQA